MKTWFSRSLIVLLLLVTLAGTAVASVDIAGSLQAIRDSRSTAVADRNAGVGASQDFGDTFGKADGEGFYTAIYADIVANPNTQVEEQIKQRFGIDFTVDLLPDTNNNGQYIFKDFFENPTGYHRSPAAPRLRDSLQSDCVRVKASQVDDKARQLSLLKKRMLEKRQQFETPLPSSSAPTPTTPPSDPLLREELLRLLEAFDTESEAQLKAAIQSIPGYRDLTDNQVLLKCYEDLSSAVDFEMKLQSILNPSRKQLEALQTFINGSLDDFSGAPGFPKYDLLFDIDVIDYIFFGTPVATDINRANEITGEADGPGGFGNYQALAEVSQPPPTLPTLPTLPGTTTPAPGSPSTTTGSTSTTVPGASSDPFATVTPGASSTEFGASSLTPAGPYCVDAPTGLNLDYSGLNPVAGVVVPASTGLTQEEAIAILRQERADAAEAAFSAVTPPPAIGTDVTVDLPINGNLTEGARSDGKNKKGLCEGNGFGFGNEFLKLIFCIDIEFAKTGKTWETTQADNCIACHLYAMNRIFEENVLKSSVRPHKNAGTIMESSICEDGYSSAVGFQFAIEWVPVKFYKDICYPQGGVTSDDYATLVGYPEIVARVNKPGFFLSCTAAFKDEKAQKRCRKAIGGSDELSYQQFQESYLASVDRKLQSTSDLKKDTSMWARLVGDEGIARREVHLLLYRLGKDVEQFDEGKIVKQDLKKGLDDLDKALQEIQRNESYTEEEKLRRLMCLKGYALNQEGRASQCPATPETGTFRELERDIDLERDRVAKITRQWNVRSRDFGKENPCGMFAGSGIIDAAFNTGALSSSYYLDTPQRRTQTLQEQYTGQIAANTEIEDIGNLLTKIDEVVTSTLESRTRQGQVEEFKGKQEEALYLYIALTAELATFRTNIMGMTNWWADMVINKQFVSKGGQKQNVLENFLEKLQ